MYHNNPLSIWKWACLFWERTPCSRSFRQYRKLPFSRSLVVEGNGKAFLTRFSLFSTSVSNPLSICLSPIIHGHSCSIVRRIAADLFSEGICRGAVRQRNLHFELSSRLSGLRIVGPRITCLREVLYAKRPSTKILNRSSIGDLRRVSDENRQWNFGLDKLKTCYFQNLESIEKV